MDKSIDFKLHMTKFVSVFLHHVKQHSVRATIITLCDTRLTSKERSTPGLNNASAKPDMISESWHWNQILYH